MHEKYADIFARQGMGSARVRAAPQRSDGGPRVAFGVLAEHIGCTPATTIYQYDEAGNKIAQVDAAGRTTAFQYDVDNRLAHCSSVGYHASYAYNTTGSANEYDTMNRLTNLVWNANGSPLASFAYTLQATGYRSSLLETVNGVGRYYAWHYDPLYRLTQEIIRGATSANIAYGYDPVGNRTNRTSNLTGLNNQTPVYNLNDWMTNSDSYDNDGNTTNSGSNLYQYDVLDHLTNVNSGQVVITSDGDGDRVVKKVGSTTTYYLVDDENPSGYAQVLEEWTSTGTPVLSKVYNYGTALISQRQPNMSTNYFISDGHGSIRMLTDIGGGVVNTAAYDAFGNLIASNGVLQTGYLYSGQQYDSALGFYYNRARYLNTGTGRFWTMDTYDGDSEDPLSLHKYLYAQDDPVDGSDPSGNAVYFVERHFDQNEELALGAFYGGNSGHGYLYFSSTTDPGSADPFESGYPIVASFSWHPNTFDTQSPEFSGGRGTPVPGRIWEDSPVDLNPSLIGPGIGYNALLVTTDPEQQQALLTYIRNWITANAPGYELGGPKTDPNDTKNVIGSVRHVPASPNGVYYSLYGQNCVWWATAMLKGSWTSVPMNVEDSIMSYEHGIGSADAILMGTLSPYVVGRLAPSTQNQISSVTGIPFALSATVDGL